MVAATYKQVSISVEDEGDDDIELTAHRVDNDDAEEELGLGSKQVHDDELIKPTSATSTIRHLNTLIILVPILLCGIVFLYSFTGRLWPAFGIAFHLHLRLGASHWFHFPKNQYDIVSSSSSSDTAEQQRSQQESTKRLQSSAKLYSFANYLDVLLCLFIYPLVIHILIKILFRDVDGTINFDWKHHVWLLRTIGGLGFLVGMLRVCELLEKWQGSLSYVYCKMLVDTSTTANQQHQQKQLIQSKKVIHFATVAAMILHIVSILSIIVHLGPIWPDIRLHSQECNPLDSSLCALPFPSFHHLIKDETTDTGYRVNLRGLPPLKGWFGLGSSQLHPTFLNELDGFSTMAPILFYLEGLKEAHEAAASSSSNNKGDVTKAELQGPSNIQYSTTNRSITLLINVNEQQLVAHSAEIDYLDPKRPLVMVIPAKPLRHNTHYAVAVVNARDVNGHRLPMSEGLKALMTKGEGNNDNTHRHDAATAEQYNRYKDVLLPVLGNAAPWINTTQVAVDYDRSNLERQSLSSSDIQLLFDFVTMSESLQIGTVRSVRDLALQHVDNSADGDHQASSSTWNWQEHVELVSEIKHNCNKEDIARTYHINLDVPFFLNQHSRYSTLDKDILMAKGTIKPTDVVPIEKAKAIIRVPCSVEKAALGMNEDEGGKAVRTIMEFGHGLFGRRDEVMDGFLSRMANDNGYILMAMDWRGMSRFDLPIVIKTLIGNPNLFQSIRDNLIQGYADKLVLQHFARYGMLDWLKIDGASIPTLNDEQPASVFYGISQGGILGGGYMALSGKTSLIDRGILGSPGTPFASVLTRSLDFIGYDTVMLFNQYSNRHVRFLISLLQMGWDSVEVSGLLAPPVKEILPPILIQTGLGDPIVGAGACESMARAMNASVLSNNPRSIFGVPVVAVAEEEEEADESSITTPKVVLTEIMYEEEYAKLPVDNAFPYPGANTNHVHWCVRWDDALISQVEEFANTGQVIDPCAADQCRRPSTSHCISRIINS